MRPIVGNLSPPAYRSYEVAALRGGRTRRATGRGPARRRINPTDVAKATQQHKTARDSINSTALPEEFASEFADYHRGAFAYDQGKEHWDEARNAWEDLLKRPEQDRHYYRAALRIRPFNKLIEEKRFVARVYTKSRLHACLARRCPKKRASSESLPNQLSGFTSYVILIPMVVMMTVVAVVIVAMPAVPIGRWPIIVAIVRIWSVITIGVIPIVPRIAVIASRESKPNSDRNLSVRTLHRNESQSTCHQCY